MLGRKKSTFAYLSESLGRAVGSPVGLGRAVGPFLGLGHSREPLVGPSHVGGQPVGLVRAWGPFVGLCSAVGTPVRMAAPSDPLRVSAGSSTARKCSSYPTKSLRVFAASMSTRTRVHWFRSWEFKNHLNVKNLWVENSSLGGSSLSYRVTIKVVSNLLLTSKQKFHFGTWASYRMEPLFGCQREVGNSVYDHPVCHYSSQSSKSGLETEYDLKESSKRRFTYSLQLLSSTSTP